MADEYKSLSAELAASRGYIFERPLAIAAIALAAFTFDENRDTVAVAALVAALLVTNLGFTVNRLENASRIVGYIRVVLEGDAPWVGWETSLEKFRERGLSPPPRKRGNTERSVRLYTPSYQLHWILMLACVVDGISIRDSSPTGANAAGLVVLGFIFVVFAFFATFKWRPPLMRQLLPRSVATWRKVVQDLEKGH